MITVIKRDELYHHGILGQKWGKRNGPPYPLDAEDHSAAEKKAAKSDKKKSLLSRTADKVGKAVDKGTDKDKISQVISKTMNSLSGSLGKELDKLFPKDTKKKMSEIKPKEETKEEPKPDNFNGDMKQVVNKHELTDKGGFDSFEWYKNSKHGVGIAYDKDQKITPKDIDEVLTNYSKANKKEIWDDCKEYFWKDMEAFLKAENGEKLTKEEFSKNFDANYRLASLNPAKWDNGNITVEVCIYPKPGKYNGYLYDHILSNEYDINFKNHNNYWSMNG